MQKRIFFLVAMLLTFTLTTMAQITTSSMAGKVTIEGTSEEVIGATVQAVHEPSGTRYAAVTNASGRFTIQGMRTGGPYEVTVTYIGFQPKKFKNVTLQLGETYNLNVWMSENATELTEVVVSGRATKFTTEKTGASTNISSAQITAIPMVNRSLTDVTRLSPYAGDGMSLAGANGKMTNFTVDGANFNNNFGLSDKLPGGGNPISLDAIEEIQVVISPYDVRQTNFIGGGINAITKSGTNTFKGTAYVYHRNENMRGDAVEREQIPGSREKDQKTTYGFTLGGPIIKNKLFFFANYEESTIPTVTTRWRGSEDGVADPDNYISRTKLADLEKVKNYMASQYGYNTGSYTSFPADETNRKLLARLDWNITDKHHLALRYNYTKNRIWNGPNASSMDGGTRLASARISKNSMSFSNVLYSMDNLVHSFSADLNSRLTDNLSNQLLFTYSKLDDIRDTDSSEFPFIDITKDGDNYMALGYELFTYNNAVHNTIWNVKDDVTYYKGQHKIMAGVNYEHQMADNQYMRNGTGYYRYEWNDDPATMFNAVPEIVNLTYGYNGETEPAARVQFNKFGFYAQDEWNIFDNLKLTYGLRIDGLFFDNGDLMTNQAIYDLDYEGRHIDTGKWPSKSISLSPRLGFTWDVFGNKILKVRGGTGLFQGRLPLVFFTNMPTNGGMVQYQANLNAKTKVFKGYTGATTTDAKGNTYIDMSQFAGGPIANKADLQAKLFSMGYPQTISSDQGTIPSAICGVDPDFKMPQVWKSSIALDYQLPVSFPFTATAEFIFNKNINDVCITDWSIPNVGGFARLNGADDRPIYPDGYRTNTKAFMLENTSKGYGWTANLTLTAQPFEWMSLMAAYTHTVKKEITGMPGSNAESAFTGVPTFEGPNNIKLHNSQYVTPDRLVASATFHDKCGNHYSLIYEGWRGSANYSFMTTNDMNGDGYQYDALYIPTDAEVANNQFRFVSEDDKTRFMDFLHNNDYLKDHQGEYAEAYSYYSPWVHRIDFSYKHDFKVCIGKTTNTLQLSFDMKNVLNFFNSEWGVAKYLNPDVFSDNPRVLEYKGLDKDGYATFATPVGIDGNTEMWKRSHSIGQCWYASVGVKYIFEGKRNERDCNCDNEPKTVIVKDNSEIERLNSEINRLRANLEDLNNRKPEKEIVVNEKVVTVTNTAPYLVNFEIGSSEIANREKVNLESVANMIKSAPDKKFYVYGYADSQTGSEKRNMNISKDRANAVRDILVNQYGVSANQLECVAKGSVNTLYLNDPQLSRSVVITEVK